MRSAALVAALLLAAVPAVALERPTASLVGERLSVEVPEAGPLEAAFEAAARALGAVLVVHRGLGETPPRRLAGSPPARVLERLAAGNGLIVSHHRAADGTWRIDRIVVLGTAGTTRPAAPAPSAASAVVADLAPPGPRAPVARAHAEALGMRALLELAKRSDAAALARVERIAKETRSGSLRRAAIGTLAAIGGPGARAAIARVTALAADPAVAAWSAQVLAAAGTTGSAR